MAESFLYDAFISYRHGERDQEVAEFLHRSLEGYRTPSEVVRKGALARLTRVFRDQDELQTSSDLSESISEALKQSRFLIVVCSPRARESPWVNQEIQRFRDLGRGDRILTLLIDGKPETSFPQSLLVKERIGRRDDDGKEVWTERIIEPLAANIIAPDLTGAKRLLKTELLRLLSPILGCSFDDLRGRHQERARRRLAAIAAGMSALTLVLATLATYAFLQRNEAITATGEAVAAKLQAEQNEERAQQNEKRAVAETDRAEQALLQRSVQESNRVAALANELANQGKIRLPMALALQVAPREGANDKRPLTPSVNALLTRLVRSDRAISSTYVGEYIYSIAATADEKWVFTGTTDGNVQFWQMPGLTFRGNVKAQDGLVGNMQVSPDQKSLLVTGTATPSVWDIESATKRFDIKLPVGFSKIAQYSPDGRFIVASSNKNKVFVASADDGTLIKTIDGPDFQAAYERALTTADRLGMTSYAEDPINALTAQSIFDLFGAMTDVAVSPDGRIIAASGSADPESAIRLYSLPDGQLLRTLSGNQFVAFSSVMSLSQRLLFSPDGAKLFAIAEGAMRSQIQAFDVASGRLVSTFLVPTVDASTLASDATGSILLSGHIDGSIVLWCTADGRFVKAFRTHSDGVNSLVPSRDGSLFVSTASGGSVALWAMPDAAQVCAARNNGKIDTQVAAIEPLAMLDGHTLNVQSALILQSTREVVTVSNDRTVRRWRVDERGLGNLRDQQRGADEYRPQPLGHKPPPLIFFDHDRKLLVSPFDSEQSSTWDLPAKRKVATFEAGRVAPDPKGEGLKIFRSPFDADPIDPATGRLDPDKKTRHPPYLYDDTWIVSPDGSRAVGVPGWSDYFAKRNVAETKVGDPPKLRQLFDTSTGESLAELGVGDKGVYTPHISQDGSKVFGLAVRPDMHSFGSATGSIAMWDALTGKLLAQTTEFEDIDTRVLASDSGSFIVALQRVPSPPHQLYRPLFFVLENDKLRKFGLNLPTELASGKGAVSAAVLSRDGLVFAAATAQGALYAWNVNNGKLIGSSQAGSVFMDNIVLSNAADMMAASDIAGRIYLFNISESQGSDIPTGIVSTGNRVRSLAFSSNGQSLAALLSDDSLRLISVDPLQFQNADKFSVLDWVTAHQFGGVNLNDKTKYGLATPQADQRSDHALLAEKPPLPTVRPDLTASVKACDKLTTDPYDRNGRAAAVETDAIVQKDAEATCEKALADDPEDATTIYQMGRILLLADKQTDAVKMLRRAADKRYPVAMSRLALLLYWEPELSRETQGDPGDLMRRAAEAGDLLGTLWTSVGKIRNNDAAAISRIIRSGTATWRMDSVAGAILAALATKKFLRLEPDHKEIALFFYQVGVILSLSSDDPRMAQKIASTYDSIRTIGLDMPPDKMVAIYRKARDWRMVAAPD